MATDKEANRCLNIYIYRYMYIYIYMYYIQIYIVYSSRFITPVLVDRFMLAGDSLKSLTLVQLVLQARPMFDSKFTMLMVK